MFDFNAIAKDLELRDLGLALTKGSARRKFVQHRKACFAALMAANKADGTDGMSDDDLLAALSA